MTQGLAAAWGGGAWDALEALAASDGSAAHPHARLLRSARASRRDLADAVHALCAVHGTHPGLVDTALARATDPALAAWLDEAAGGLARERHALARVVSAAGPLPSTPGQAATDAAWATQRHAFDLLARSERAGVALGAAAALLLDWAAVRRMVARAAEAYGVALAPATLPGHRESAAMVALAPERALLFGARALLDQHRALWTLLAARAEARGG